MDVLKIVLLCLLASILVCVGLIRNIAKLKEQLAKESKEHEDKICRISEECRQEIENVRDEAEAKVKSEEEHCNQIIRSIQEQADQRIRHDREQIQGNKEKLLQMTDKELLVEALSAIHTYASRIDRVDNRLSEMVASIEEAASHSKENRPKFVFSSQITSDDLLEIAKKAARGFTRIANVYVSGGIIYGNVLSQNGNSEWEFSVNFFDANSGKITGDYELSSDKDNSSIPEYFAEEVKKEICYRLYPDIRETNNNI